MVEEVDLSVSPATDPRDRLFEALDGLDPGERIAVRADRDLEGRLHQYRIVRGVPLEWSSERDDSGTWDHEVTRRDAEGDDRPVFDVRDLPPRRRHDLFTGTFDALDPGRGFVLVNDHDPKPPYHQFDAEAGEEFRWEYRARDPGEFRVLIGKADDDGSASSGRRESEAPF